MSRIPKAEYARRRKALMAQMVPNSIAILPAAAVAIRTVMSSTCTARTATFNTSVVFPSPRR